MSSNHNTMAQSGGKEKSIDLDSSAVDTKGTRESNKNPRKDQTTTTLIIILIAIIVVIASLVGIVIYNLINQNNQNINPESTNNTALVYPTEEQLEKNRQEKDKITSRADEIYDNNPANTNLVIDYYADLADNAANDNLSYSYTMQAQAFMADRELKEGELAVIERFDFAQFGGDLAYLAYARALELATELGDEAAVAKYQVLASEYKKYNDAAAEQNRKSQEGAVLDETSIK